MMVIVIIMMTDKGKKITRSPRRILYLCIWAMSRNFPHTDFGMFLTCVISWMHNATSVLRIWTETDSSQIFSTLWASSRITTLFWNKWSCISYVILHARCLGKWIFHGSWSSVSFIRCCILAIRLYKNYSFDFNITNPSVYTSLINTVHQGNMFLIFIIIFRLPLHELVLAN
jgi:hypothetical protein